MPEISKDEIRNFLLQGTFTGKLVTINKNGTPHVVPIWFTLDDEDNIIFNTGSKSIPIRDMFGAIFFVSVRALMDKSLLLIFIIFLFPSWVAFQLSHVLEN